jgi:hypothetical protein
MMLQGSSFIRQTRRLSCSLEAVPPKSRVVAPAGHLHQPESATHAVRMEGSSSGTGPRDESLKAQGRFRAQQLLVEPPRANTGEEMFLAGKVALSGIVFILLVTGISGPRPPPLASGTDLSKEVPEGVHRNDVEKIQQTLRGKGHYRGEIDGVFGLRTAASIRAYQKAENLLITGQVDKPTADKLGVKPEVREETGYETSKGKPSAYIKKTKGAWRTSKTLQAENNNQPR